MFDDLKALLVEKYPSNIILHIGNNNTVNKPGRIILDKILSIKNFIKKVLPVYKVIILNIT